MNLVRKTWNNCGENEEKYDHIQEGRTREEIRKSEYGRPALVVSCLSWVVLSLFGLGLCLSEQVWAIWEQILPLCIGGAVVSIVLGHLGRRKGRQQRRAATIGLVLGYLQLAVIFVGIVIVFGAIIISLFSSVQ